MRIPGIHVLLTAGVVAVTSIGAVTAFSLTSSSEAEQRLPDVAPPPGVAAPLDPAPLPAPPPSQPAAPAPIVAQEPTQDPEPTAERDRGSDDRDEPTRERPEPPRGDDKPDTPSTVKPDPDGTREQKLAYACQHGFLEGKICKGYT